MFSGFGLFPTCRCSHSSDDDGRDPQRGDDDGGGEAGDLGRRGGGGGQRPLVEVLETQVSQTLEGEKGKTSKTQREDERDAVKITFTICSVYFYKIKYCQSCNKTWKKHKPLMLESESENLSSEFLKINLWEVIKKKKKSRVSWCLYFNLLHHSQETKS